MISFTDILRNQANGNLWNLIKFFERVKLFADAGMRRNTSCPAFIFCRGKNLLSVINILLFLNRLHFGA